MGFLLQALDRLLPDPHPQLVFEIGDQVLLGVRRSGEKIEADTRQPLPLPDEEDGGEQMAATLESAVGASLEHLRPLPGPHVAVLLPDHATRMAVFDFEKLPKRPQEMRRVVEERFAVSLPFDIRAARIAYRTQGGSGPPSVLATAVSSAHVRQCESAFQALGLIPGYVGLATASTLNLIGSGPMTLLVKLGGEALTMVASENGVVRLVRRISLPTPAPEDVREAVGEVLADLFPTVAYIEENLERPVARLLLCGFGSLLGPALQIMRSEVSVSVEPLAGADGKPESMGTAVRGYIHG